MGWRPASYERLLGRGDEVVGLAGYAPKVPIEVRLRRFVAWFRQEATG